MLKICIWDWDGTLRSSHNAILSLVSYIHIYSRIQILVIYSFDFSYKIMKKYEKMKKKKKLNT